MKTIVVTVFISDGLAYLFMRFLDVGGLTLGMTVALVINFVVLMWLLRRKIGVIRLGRTAISLLRVLGASLVMGAVIWVVDFSLQRAVDATLGGYAIRLVVGIVVGVLTFLLAAKLGKMPELAETEDMLRTVLKRSRREDKAA